MRLAIVMIASSTLVTACSSTAVACDTSTDAAVKALAKRLVPDLPADPCIERATSFPGLISVGTLINDLGCRYNHTIYACVLDPKDYDVRAMAAAGWANADIAKRTTLAKAWLREVGAENIIETAPTDWAGTGKPFAAVRATASKDGTFELDYWRERPSGMMPEAAYDLTAVTFAASGAIAGTKQLDSVTIRSIR